jgi:hypothetical protein
MISITVITMKRGVQWNRSQAGVLERGLGPQEEKRINLIGITVIGMKRGVQ